jgi:hypothetical protein
MTSPRDVPERVVIPLPDGFEIPDIHISEDNEGDMLLEWIFSEGRLGITVCRDGEVYWHAVSKEFSASGTLRDGTTDKTAASRPTAVSNVRRCH